MINDDTKTLLSRRAFLGQSGIGLGTLAATSLLSEAYAGQSETVSCRISPQRRNASSTYSNPAVRRTST